jgi:hypothetical protein
MGDQTTETICLIEFGPERHMVRRGEKFMVSSILRPLYDAIYG